MKIAIIGTGISSLGAASLIEPYHDITVYEKNEYIGGHGRTIDINVDGKTVPVDTGFIVFNNWNYPNLVGLFNKIGVPYVDSDMSFGVSIKNGWLEYSSNELFAPRNLVQCNYIGMLKDIIKFNKKSIAYIEKSTDITLGECLDELGMGDWFKQYYLLAMGGAIWSCPLETILLFPAKTFLHFFKNHGLLNLIRRPQWHTVHGGSREYISRLTEPFKEKIKLGCGIEKVERHEDQWVVIDQSGSQELYDQIVFGCHANQALDMLDNTSKDVSEILSAFTYQKNKVVVHSDESYMPVSKKSWASWVYLSESKKDEKEIVSLSYWMNNLQPLDTEKTVLVTLNPGRMPKENLIYDEYVFEHPIFDTVAIRAQKRIQEIQGRDGLWFCGAYQRYGFHEDGLWSSVNVVKKMGISIPWE